MAASSWPPVTILGAGAAGSESFEQLAPVQPHGIGRPSDGPPPPVWDASPFIGPECSWEECTSCPATVT
ncbi:MAG TPA: hypothetical protein VKU82_14260 [Planctomycetaceae bacterium]|nr:hypothetical protein [Planctomycetaceae bacterium]